MRKLVIAALGIVLVGFVLVIIYGDSARAQFYVSVFSSLGVLVAIVVALYGERIKADADPLKLIIEVPPGVNNRFDAHPLYGPDSVYVHHLRVKNLATHRTVVNCRLWLEHVEDEQADGSFSEIVKFAVPRMLDWAPAEYSPDCRTFADEQIADFGFSLRHSGGFLFKANKWQTGFAAGYLSCDANRCRRYLFKITADNYVPRRLISVTVRPKPFEGDAVKTSIVVDN